YKAPRLCKLMIRSLMCTFEDLLYKCSVDWLIQITRRKNTAFCLDQLKDVGLHFTHDLADIIASNPLRIRAIVSALPNVATMSNTCGPNLPPTSIIRKGNISSPIFMPEA